MIIGIDASRANRLHKTGTEWYSFYLIKWLAKIDQKNEYILYSDKPLTGGLCDLTSGQSAIFSEQKEVEYDVNGFQKIKSPGKNFRASILRWPFGFFWTQGRLSLEMVIRKPDVLFVPAHALPFCHPKRSIVTIHDIGYEIECGIYHSNQIGPEGKKSRKVVNALVRLFTRGRYEANTIDYLRWSTEFAMRKADKIISVSQFTKENLIKTYKTDPKKISVIHNGYNNDLYRKIDDEDKINDILNKYGIPRPYLLYVGRLERKKNIHNLIEAYAILKEKRKDLPHKLILVGNASYGFDEIKYMLNEYDIVSDVLMPGWLPEADLPYIFNAASAFVFPSYYEGFGIPLLQAMACEVPVAASNLASLPEVAGDAALFFDPCNPEAIAEGLAKILDDKNLRSELIKKGTERIKSFSWEKTARETHKKLTYEQ